MHKQFALRSQREMRKCRGSRLLSFEKWVGFEKVEKEKKGLLDRAHIIKILRPLKVWNMYRNRKAINVPEVLPTQQIGNNF